MVKMVQREKNGDKGDKGDTGANGTNGKDGKDGKDGTNGTNGVDGQDGEDGFSPIITETQTSTGYDISITDKNGTRTISLLNGQDGNANPQIFYWDGSTDSTGLAFWNEVYQAQKERPCIVIHAKVLQGNYVTFSWNYNNNMPTTSFETIEPNVYSRVVSSVNQSSGFDSLSVYWFLLYFTITNDVVTKINTNSSASKVNFLSTTRDYNQVYTPLYNGSPVTKKYVDDSISNAITNAIGGSY